MQKTLLIIGVTFVVIGLFWPWLWKIPLGRLPGDIFIDRPGVKIYIPITSMIVISLIITLLVRFFKK